MKRNCSPKRRASSAFNSSFTGLETLENRHMLSAGLEVIASYAGSFDSSGNSLGMLDFSNPASRNSSYQHLIEFRIKADDFAADQDFGSVVFNINLGSHLHAVGTYPWKPVNGQYDFLGDPPGEVMYPYWGKNENIPPTTDLQNIWVAVDTASTAQNRQYGEAARPGGGAPDTLGYPTLVGSVRVTWDGTPTLLTVASSGGNAWTTIDNNATGNGAMVPHATGLVCSGVSFNLAETALISIGNASVTEGNSGTSNMNFTVSVAGTTASDISFNFATFLQAGDAAVAGQDFTPVNQTVIIPAGVTSMNVSVPIIGDNINEDTETFHVQISDPLHAGIDVSQATGTIIDNDPPPTISINDPSQAEGNVGLANMPLVVSLSAASSKTVTVQYVTSPLTASVPDDLHSVSGTLTFAPGETTKTINVPIVGDAVIERSETFKITLANATNATIGKSYGTGTIVNDDVPAADAYEPDNTSAAATTIVPDGAAQNHTLSSANDQDWVKFDLATYRDVTITTGGTLGDTRLTLYSASDLVNPITINDNYGGGMFSQIRQVLAPGTYYVKVDNGGNDSALATYSLSVTTSDTNFLLFGGATKAKATFTDSQGVAVTVYLKGLGDGELWMTNAGSGDALKIVTNNTTSKSSLVITTTKGTTTTVRDIIVNGSISSIIGKTANLGGDVTVSGTLAKLQMADTTGEHSLAVGAPATSKSRLAVTLAHGHDLSIRSDTPISTISVADWTNVSGGSMYIRAPFISKISSKGAFAPDVVLSGIGATSYTLSSASISGNVTGDWDITGSAGTISVKGTLESSVLRTTGNISSVSLGAAVDSSVLAGIRSDVMTHPTIGDHFTSVSTIKSLKIVGWSVPRGQTLPRLIHNSYFAANVITSASLKNGDEASGFGVYIPSQSTVLQMKTLKYADTLDKTQNVSWKYTNRTLPSMLHLI